MWGVCGASCEVHYSASKAALIGMTKALARELAPSNIQVNCIAPGIIDAEEVASLMLFLADERSDFITGQVIGIDGGFI